MSRAQEALDQAAQWLLRQEDEGWSEQDQVELNAWLGAAEGHKAAYWRLKHSWTRADRMRALGPLRSFRARRRSLLSWTSVAVAASLTLVSTFTLYNWAYLSSLLAPRALITQEEVRIDTPVGVQKHVRLSDGTSIDLNTASSIRVRMSDSLREVVLERGEAYFEVAHLEDHPFVIASGPHIVTVLGTKFTVRHDPAKTTVAVMSGRVQLAGLGKATGNRLAVLTRGDVAVASGNSTLVTTHTPQEMENLLSWRGGMLSFDDTPLGVAAAEFNRYNRRQIMISDAAVAQMRIGGSFPSTKPDTFLRLLQNGYDLKVKFEGDVAKISR